jgi:hypothetical protein
MDKQLPLNQEQLENFILHHVHAWAEDYVAQNKDDYPDVTLYESMDHEFSTFVLDLADKFRGEVLPRFGEQ